MSRSCAAVIQVDDPEGAAFVLPVSESAARRRNGNNAHALWHGDAENLERRLSSGRLLYRARPANLWPDLLQEDLDACLDGGRKAKGRSLGKEGPERRWRKSQKPQVQNGTRRVCRQLDAHSRV